MQEEAIVRENQPEKDTRMRKKDALTEENNATRRKIKAKKGSIEKPRMCKKIPKNRHSTNENDAFYFSFLLSTHHPPRPPAERGVRSYYAPKFTLCIKVSICFVLYSV